MFLLLRINNVRAEVLETQVIRSPLGTLRLLPKQVCVCGGGERVYSECCDEF